mmetsp:Transcript_576/g.857  ORF Transcript_576/g.857 Transcript_576/m.857 type:complete len:88 (+) Transcript_576:93-356(+)
MVPQNHSLGFANRTRILSPANESWVAASSSSPPSFEPEGRSLRRRDEDLDRLVMLSHKEYYEEQRMHGFMFEELRRVMGVKEGNKKG